MPIALAAYVKILRSSKGSWSAELSDVVSQTPVKHMMECWSKAPHLLDATAVSSFVKALKRAPSPKEWTALLTSCAPPPQHAVRVSPEYLASLSVHASAAPWPWVLLNALWSDPLTQPHAIDLVRHGPSAHMGNQDWVFGVAQTANTSDLLSAWRFHHPNISFTFFANEVMDRVERGEPTVASWWIENHPAHITALLDMLVQSRLHLQSPEMVERVWEVAGPHADFQACWDWGKKCMNHSVPLPKGLQARLDHEVLRHAVNPGGRREAQSIATKKRM